MYANPERAVSDLPTNAEVMDIADDASLDATAGIAITLESTDLLRGSRAICIRHNGALYRLQRTKLGKLILTK